jgi:hypothetical protein
MPFKSKKQLRWMYANKPELAKKFKKKTKSIKALPEKAKKKSSHEQRMTAFLRIASDMDRNRDFLMAKQPINIMFFNMLADRVAPEAKGSDRTEVENSLFLRLLESPIHNAINELAENKLEGRMDAKEIYAEVESMVTKTYRDLL